MISSSYAASRAEPIDWLQFLARPRLPSPAAESLARLESASVLITGAAGSIGSELSLQIARLRPRSFVLLDASEQALHRLQSSLKDADLEMQPLLVLGNISDPAHLEEIFESHRPSLIFHAAAHKHVPLLEEHPLEAITNNALGTLTLADCARRFGTDRIVLLSTDKAVAPTSILGATKRIAERIVLAQDGVVVRLGNVLGTQGSVSETFLHQIAAGGPVTLTDPGAERYFLTREEAVDLLLASAVSARSGSLLIPDLARQYPIAALADFLIAKFSPTQAIQMVCTGTRAGDKASEALWSSEEATSVATVNGCLEIHGITPDLGFPAHSLERLTATGRRRDLPGALEAVQALVPDYAPSSVVISQMQSSMPGANPR